MLDLLPVKPATVKNGSNTNWTKKNNKKILSFEQIFNAIITTCTITSELTNNYK